MIGMGIEIAGLVIAFIFAYLYSTEKEFILKFVWLILSLMSIIYASTQTYQLHSTTTTNSTTTYNYIQTTYLLPYSYGIGMVLIGLVVFFAWLLIKRFNF